VPPNGAGLAKVLRDGKTESSTQLLIIAFIFALHYDGYDMMTSHSCVIKK